MDSFFDSKIADVILVLLFIVTLPITIVLFIAFFPIVMTIGLYIMLFEEWA